jgi:hypothetical protein
MVMRFGLIGLGAAGRLRKAALARAPDCVLTAAFDLDRTRTEDTAPTWWYFLPPRHC